MSFLDRILKRNSAQHPVVVEKTRYNYENIARYRKEWKILTIRLPCWNKIKALRRKRPNGKFESMGDVVERLVAAQEMVSE